MSSARTPFFLDSRTCLFHQGEARARSLGRCLRPASGWNQPLPKLPVIILAHSSSLFSLLYPLRLFSLFSSATGMPTLLRQVIWRSNGDSDGGMCIDRADAAARCRADVVLDALTVPMPCSMPCSMLCQCRADAVLRAGGISCSRPVRPCWWRLFLATTQTDRR